MAMSNNKKWEVNGNYPFFTIIHHYSPLFIIISSKYVPLLHDSPMNPSHIPPRYPNPHEILAKSSNPPILTAALSPGPPHQFPVGAAFHVRQCGRSAQAWPRQARRLWTSDITGPAEATRSHGFSQQRPAKIWVKATKTSINMHKPWNWPAKTEKKTRFV